MMNEDEIFHEIAPYTHGHLQEPRCVHQLADETAPRQIYSIRYDQIDPWRRKDHARIPGDLSKRAAAAKIRLV